MRNYVDSLYSSLCQHVLNCCNFMNILTVYFEPQKNQLYPQGCSQSSLPPFYTCCDSEHQSLRSERSKTASWKSNCRWRIRGHERTLELIEALLLTLSPATDTLGVPLFREEMRDIWKEQKHHVPCIHDPPNVQLLDYTITGHAVWVVRGFQPSIVRGGQLHWKVSICTLQGPYHTL